MCSSDLGPRVSPGGAGVDHRDPIEQIGGELGPLPGVPLAGQGGGPGGGLVEETALNPAANFTATVGVKNGVWTYTSANGTNVASTVRADGNWHNLVVSHYTARGETLFYVDGQLAGRTAERLEPNSFRLGGTAVDLRDALLYRSGLNDDEVAALQSGTLLQSSLEIYAPLADATFASGAPVENRAQSLTAFTAGTGLAHLAQ